LQSKVKSRQIKTLEAKEEKHQFALAVKDHMGNGFKKSKAKEKLVRFLDYAEGLKENTGD